MTPVEFRILSRWRVKGNVDDVYDVITTPQDFVRWWSAVYLRVEEVEPGDENGVGRIFNLHTRSLLPYTLDWQARATEVEKSSRLVVKAHGDLEGTGEWRFCQDGDWVRVDYNWTVVANKPWMRYLAPVLRPVYAANHRWAMRKGQQGLERELERIRHNRNGERPTPKSVPDHNRY